MVTFKLKNTKPFEYKDHTYQANNLEVSLKSVKDTTLFRRFLDKKKIPYEISKLDEKVVHNKKVNKSDRIKQNSLTLNMSA